jgi:hypothetical protein
MDDPTHDFGTGLRAHLGLEQAEIDELLAEAAGVTEAAAADAPTDDEPDEDAATLEVLIAFEHELLARERLLARREKALATRAGALLAAAQSLHDEVVGNASKPRDELARMRRRKSGAA